MILSIRSTLFPSNASSARVPDDSSFNSKVGYRRSRARTMRTRYSSFLEIKDTGNNCLINLSFKDFRVFKKAETF